MHTLVMLPGLDGTGRLLSDFAQRVAPQFQATCILPYPTDVFLDYDALTAHVLSRLPATPFVLLAESFSGPVALRVAARAPAHLAGLVLSATFARGPFHALSPLTPLLRVAPVHLPDALLRAVLLGPGCPRALLRTVSGAVAGVAPAVLRRRAMQAVRVDDRALLPRIGVPVLALHAAHDRLLPRRTRGEFAAGLRDLQQVEVAGPHVLLQARPDACAMHLRQFVQARLPRVA